MANKKVSSEELDNVSGAGIETETIECPKCHNIIDKYKSLVKQEKHSCSYIENFYKCPKCGHEWSADSDLSTFD